tara:strand:- start:31 stop:285 length:255 start_codon:yes stop_codon:yes gene_type:complete
MNEKFKLLALEAKMGTADFDAGSYYVATPDRMQKLCELIVRECANFAYNYSYDEKNVEHYRENGWDCLPGDLRSEMKEHFGVEE